MSNPFTKTWQKRGDPSSSKRQPIRNWSGTLKRLWTYLAVFRKQLLVVLGLVCLSSLCALLGPLFIGWLLDHYVLLGQYEGLLFFLVLLFSLYTVGSASVWLQNTLMIRLAQKTIFALRKDLFHHVHALPLSYFQQKKHGDVMSRLTNDIENISATLNSSFIQILSSILTFIGILTVMLWLSPLLTVLTLTVVPAMIVGMKWITNRTGPYFKEQQRQMGEVNGFIEETISGRAVIQTFSREDEMIAAFQSKNAQLKKAGFWAQTYSGFIPKLMNLLNSISFAIIAGIGGILALRELVTIGTIVIFAEYARQFTRPLNDLANQFNTMLSAVAGAERVFDLMDQEGESDSEKAVSLATVRGEVCFQNVSFSYQKEDSGKTVSDIHFSVSPGETIALVGPTGAGKTTILQLLARFYEVDDGTISIDRHDTQQLKLANLRQHIGFALFV
ncbi:ATP-binding cassette subfamily B protein [Halalkalibacter oceani]